jgi:hypothetical protein
MSPISEFLKQLGKSGLLSSSSDSAGGAVVPAATPLQYDDGGEVADLSTPMYCCFRFLLYRF